MWRLAPVLFCAACASAPTVMPATPYEVDRGECRKVDLEEIRVGIQAGYDRALRDRPDALSVEMDGLTIRGERDPEWNGIDLVGEYDPNTDEMVFRCGEEWTVGHETGHRVAFKLGVTCWDSVWHPVAYGSGVVDMRCRVNAGKGHALGKREEIN